VAALAAGVRDVEGAGGDAGGAGARALLLLLTATPEFAEVPVRHNEDELNEGLGLLLEASGWAPPRGAHGAKPAWGSPHVKAYLLLAARMARAPLPHVDYATDTKTVMDAAGRVLGAAVEVAALVGARACVEAGARLAQGLAACALPGGGGALGALPGGERARAALAPLAGAGAPGSELRRLAAVDDGRVLAAARAGGAGGEAARELLAALRAAPVVGVAVSLLPPAEGAAAAAPGAPLTARFSLTLPPPPPQQQQPARGGGGARGGAAKARAAGGWLAICHGPRLLALRKCGLERRRGEPPGRVVQLSFHAPLAPGAHELEALLLCDAVLGTDAVVALRVVVAGRE
jgi:hypothetical protein